MPNKRVPVDADTGLVFPAVKADSAAGRVANGTGNVADVRRLVGVLVRELYPEAQGISIVVNLGPGCPPAAIVVPMPATTT